jgi:hypothetical protein
MVDQVCLMEQDKKAIGQYIRRNNEILLNETKENLPRTHRKTVSI